MLGGDIDRTTAGREGEPAQFGEVSAAHLGRPPVAAGGRDVDRIICNPPFGKQLSSPGRRSDRSIRARSGRWIACCGRKGKAVLLVADAAPLKAAIRPTGGSRSDSCRCALLGQRAVIMVYRKT